MNRQTGMHRDMTSIPAADGSFTGTAVFVISVVEFWVYYSASSAHRPHSTSRADDEPYAAGNTDALASAINSLPELQRKKAVLDMHTITATAILKELKAREIDAYFSLEEDTITKAAVRPSPPPCPGSPALHMPCVSCVCRWTGRTSCTSSAPKVETSPPNPRTLALGPRPQRDDT